MKSGLGGLKDALVKGFTLPMDIAGAGIKGYQDGIKSKDFGFGKNKVEESGERSYAVDSNGNPVLTNANGAPISEGAGKSKGSKLESSVAGISGGRPTHVTINIDSLIKNNTNQITNIKDPGQLAGFMDNMKMALMTMLNDSQIIAG